MTNKDLLVLLLLSTLLGFTSCKPDPKPEEKSPAARLADALVADLTMPPAQGAARLDADFRHFTAVMVQLRVLADEMTALRSGVGLNKRGYYTADEHDQIEHLLFRYMGCRDAMLDLVGYYLDNNRVLADAKLQTRGFVLGFGAALNVYFYSSLLVSTFIDEPQVTAKLNEDFHRAGIPRGTYDLLFKQITDIDNMNGIAAAWHLFLDEGRQQNSELVRLSKTNAAYAELMQQFPSLYAGTRSQVQKVLKERSVLFPELRNRVRHTQTAEFARKSATLLSDNLYTARGIVFENVSRIKAPLINVLIFDVTQIREVKSLLQPGDLIFTFTAGYMSNLFLPGSFKHGITFTGTPQQRCDLGLSAAAAGLSGKRAAAFDAALRCGTLGDGAEADVIEAVAEGVVFNSLEYLMRTHINRMLVLRPVLGPNQRRQQLSAVFALLGCGYDFRFDFVDASFQCCTEVIYRSLNKRDGIEFGLVRRMGKQTLSADDLVSYFLGSGSGRFELVMLVVEDDIRPGRASLYTGETGLEQLKKLMGAAVAVTGPAAAEEL